VPEREWLEHTIAHSFAQPRVQRLARAERAVSGRAHCRQCKELIAQGEWRLALHIFEEWRFSPLGYVHAACAAAYFESREIATRLERLCPELTADDLGEIDALVRAVPASSPGLVKTSAEPAADAKKSGS
jgi:hypothetical protein